MGIKVRFLWNFENQPIYKENLTILILQYTGVLPECVFFKFRLSKNTQLL